MESNFFKPPEAETELKSPLPAAYHGSRLLDYLCQRFPYQDRATWDQAVREGRVRVNREAASPDAVLSRGDLVSYRVTLREPEVETHLRLVHDEEDFLVADKPAHLPSHADGNFIRNTFIYILSRQMGFTTPEHRLYLAHRLDRETSGLMVVAKKKDTLKKLMKEFSENRVEKRYLALAKGRFERKEGLLEGWIGKDPGSSISIKRAVVPDGTPEAKPSATEYRVLEEFAQASLVEARPRTGRTNQIRVHLAAAGHPLVGDKMYGRSDQQYLDYVFHMKSGRPGPYQGGLEAGRHMLHAAVLAFSHPASGRALRFEAAPPEDFTRAVEFQKAILPG